MPSQRVLTLRQSAYDAQDKLAEYLGGNQQSDGSYDIDQQKANEMEGEVMRLFAELKAQESFEAMEERHSSARSERRQVVNGHTHAGGNGASSLSHASLGELVKAELSKHRSSGRKDMEFELACDMKAWLEPEYKALMTTTAGWIPARTRVPRIAEKIMPGLEILDLFPFEDTDLARIEYMEETTSLSGITAEIPEGGTYPEATEVFTPRSLDAKKIGTSLPITDEQLSDVAQLPSFIDGRMRYFVRKRLETQLISGDGTGVNILGILSHPSTQTQAKGALSTAEAVYLAMTKVRVTGEANPTVFLVNPNDWAELKLVKDTTGNFIWGSPSQAGPQFMWGIPVVETTVLPSGTGLVFDSAHYLVYVRQQAIVEIGWVGTQFVEGKQTLRSSLRAVLAQFRGEAACTVTGI